MTGTAITVTVLSAVGFISEFAGILKVSGHSAAVWRLIHWPWLRAQSALRRPRGVSQELPAAEERDQAFGLGPGLGSDAWETKVDRRLEGLERRIVGFDGSLAETDRRITRLRQGLPDEIRSHSAAPVDGVGLLLLGLLCFVAANVVAVTLG